MRDWIVGLLKAASERRSGASPEDLARVETELGRPLPAELAELYTAAAGGDFLGEVTLHPLFADEETAGLVEQSREDLPGLPSTGIVRFGLRGGAEHLFAVVHSQLTPLLGETGGWMAAIPQDGWVFGVKNLDTGGIRFFRSLEVMLSELVPPAQTEGFGENTFIRAFNAVQSAIETASSDQADAKAAESTPTGSEARPSAATPKPKAATAASKSATSAAKATKAKPAKKPAAARKPPAKKKPATKKPAAKKAAARKKPAAKKAPARGAAKKSAARNARKPAKKPARRAAPAKKSAKRAAPKKPAARKKATKGRAKR